MAISEQFVFQSKIKNAEKKYFQIVFFNCCDSQLAKSELSLEDSRLVIVK